MNKRLLEIFIFLIGLAIFLFPVVSNTYNSKIQYETIMDYDAKVNKLKKKDIDAQIELANEFNRRLAGGEPSGSDLFSKENLSGLEKLDSSSYPAMFNTEEVIGHLEIPKIDARLPVYNGVSEDILGKGIGYMRNTSLPVGGEATHTVLTGHRGLPTAQMFRHLDRLKRGDQFYIKVLGQTLAYEVDQIKVVLPTDTSDIRIEPGKDYATLVTCEPYAINTHRLLVRGHRVPYSEERAREEGPDGYGHIRYIGFGLVSATALAIAVRTRKSNKA